MQPDVGQRPAPASEATALATVSWILLGLTLFLSFTNLLSHGIWLLPWPVVIAVIIMAIKVRTRRQTAQEARLLVAALLLVPLSYVAQFISLAIYGAAAMKEEQWQATQMLENLRRIEQAKEQWVAATDARHGLPITMSNLTIYLKGKEVEPVMGERYDPQPVGRTPTATLPEEKHLWSYPIAGATYTAGALVKALANTTSNPINLATGEFLHPSGRWLPWFSEPGPRPIAAENETPASED